MNSRDQIQYQPLATEVAPPARAAHRPLTIPLRLLAAAAAALGIVLRGRRLEAAVGFLAAAAALGAVLLYRFVDVGSLGPLPDMYEPIWYTEKAVSAIAEGVAVLACLALFAVRQHEWSRRSVLRHR